MIRNLKVLGLVLGAVFALSAIAASSALAVEEQGELTSDGPVRLVGTDTLAQPSVLTFDKNQKVTCHGAYDAGLEGATETEEFPVGSGKFRHKIATLPTTNLTISPTYTKCISEKEGVKASSTVTMNGCDFVLHIGTTNGTTGQYKVTADVVCPAGKVIEIHAYSSEKHESSICTYTIGPQTGIGGTAFVQNEAGGKVTLGGSFQKFTATRHKTVLCGNLAQETKEAELHVHSILEGFNAGGTPTAIELTEKGI